MTFTFKCDLDNIKLNQVDKIYVKGHLVLSLFSVQRHTCTDCSVWTTKSHKSCSDLQASLASIFALNFRSRERIGSAPFMVSRSVVVTGVYEMFA